MRFSDYDFLSFLYAASRLLIILGPGSFIVTIANLHQAFILLAKFLVDNYTHNCAMCSRDSFPDIQSSAEGDLDSDIANTSNRIGYQQYA